MKIKARDYMAQLVNKTNILKEINEKDRENLKKVLLHMLVEIQNVCFQNHIDFCLAYGSALGAYRHKGFIPWDDDLDIQMTRDNWDKLKKNFTKILGKNYILEIPNYENKDSKTLWGKIYLKGTSLVEIEDTNTTYNCGIYIDVFVLDYLPENKILRNMKMKSMYFLRAVTTSIKYYKNPSKMMEEYMSTSFQTKYYHKARKFLGFLFSFYNHKQWCNFVDNFANNSKISPYMSSSFEPLEQKVEYFLPFSTGVFEGVEVHLPCKIEAYLESIYGKDYMTLPPVEKRERHYYVELDFGPYKNQ